MSFACRYDRKIDKIAENFIFLCFRSTNLFFSLPKQTLVVNFSRLFQKYIHFYCYWCIFECAKIKHVAVRPPSILYIFFSIFLSQKEIQLWIKLHLAQEFQPACKTKVHLRRFVNAIVSNVMRTCKSVSVQVDQRVYFLLPGIEPASTRRRTAKGDSVCFGIFIYLLFLKLQIHIFIATIIIHLYDRMLTHCQVPTQMIYCAEVVGLPWV